MFLCTFDAFDNLKKNRGGTPVRILVHVHELYFCCYYIIWGKGCMEFSGTWQLANLAILHEDYS